MPADRELAPDFENPPVPAWGRAMVVRREDDGAYLIKVEAPGLRGAPPAKDLLLASGPVMLTGVGIGAGAVVADFGKPGSLFELIVGAGVGFWVGWFGVWLLRTAVAVAWDTTEIRVGREVLRAVRRSVRSPHAKPVEVEVKRADYWETDVASKIGGTFALEVLTVAKGSHRVRVLSGRSREEMVWLAALIEAQLGPSRFRESEEVDDGICGSEREGVWEEAD